MRSKSLTYIRLAFILGGGDYVFFKTIMYFLKQFNCGSRIYFLPDFSESKYIAGEVPVQQTDSLKQKAIQYRF